MVDNKKRLVMRPESTEYFFSSIFIHSIIYLFSFIFIENIPL